MIGHSPAIALRCMLVFGCLLGAAPTNFALHVVHAATIAESGTGGPPLTALQSIDQLIIGKWKNSSSETNEIWEFFADKTMTITAPYANSRGAWFIQDGHHLFIEFETDAQSPSRQKNFWADFVIQNNQLKFNLYGYDWVLERLPD